MRASLIAILLIALPIVDALAQSSSAAVPSFKITPSFGDLSTAHQASARYLPADVPVLLALFDPTGNQVVTQTRTDEQGSLDVSLLPPGGAWQTGLYRWVMALADGKSFSATFVASDGQPHLFELPKLPSPTSAFNLIGIGFPAHASVEVDLFLSGLGQDTLHETTDADGTFSLFVWPGQFGLPFFPAGEYEVTAPSLKLSDSFMVREHPVGAAIAVGGTVISGGLANVRFENYAAGRYLWGVFANANGQLAGEFLTGPTTIDGSFVRALVFPPLDPGQDFLATPYDWGETTFTVPAPTPTSTPTVTPMPTPTATAVPTAEPVSHASCKRKHKHRKRKCTTHRAPTTTPTPGRLAS